MAGILTDEERDRIIIEMNTNLNNHCKVQEDYIKSNNERHDKNEQAIADLEKSVSGHATALKWITGVGATLLSALGISVGVK